MVLKRQLSKQPHGHPSSELPVRCLDIGRLSCSLLGTYLDWSGESADGVGDGSLL